MTARRRETRRSIARDALYSRVWSEPMMRVAADLGISRNGLEDLRSPADPLSGSGPLGQGQGRIRAGLRAERRARTTSGRRDVTDRLNRGYGVPRDLAYGATVILTGVVLRAGRLLAERKIPLDMAERLSLAIVTAGNRRVAGRSRPEP